MVDRVWCRVLSVTTNHYISASATLKNHQRFCVKNETHPGMVAANGQALEGIVYFNITPEHIALLDEFEGADYVRSSLLLIDSMGKPLNAQTYIYQRPDLLTPSLWTLDQFDEASFMKQYVGFK